MFARKIPMYQYWIHYSEMVRAMTGALMVAILTLFKSMCNYGLNPFAVQGCILGNVGTYHSEESQCSVTVTF